MTKQTVKIGRLVLGDGSAKICVPVMGHSFAELKNAASKAQEAGAELIELRIDSFSPSPSEEELEEACLAVRSNCTLSLLLTLRTARDGGQGTTDSDRYEHLLDFAIQQKLCDALDVERSIGGETFKRLLASAHHEGIPVIGSMHYFKETPEETQMRDALLEMASLGAEIAKLAVMPKNRMDVARLIAAAIAADEVTDRPIVAISMGYWGRATRLLCNLTGSCMTFAQVGKGSAPGQMDISTVRALLKGFEE